MLTKGKSILVFTTVFILGTYFLIAGLFHAKAFLTPLLTASVLALLVLPLSKLMEKRISRGGASFINTLLLLLISIGFMSLFSIQIKNFVDQWPEIKETMEPKIEQVTEYLFEHTPLEKEDLERSEEEKGIPFIGSGSDAGRQAVTFLNTVMDFLGKYLLTFIYIFFLLNYRSRFKQFLLRLFSKDKKEEILEVLNNSAKIAQQYLVGKLILIGVLAVLYSIGLGISGVTNFILVSALAAVFTLIPYVGNMVGFAMAMALGYLTSGETSVLIGVTITFSAAQLIENYLLEPYIIGDKVDLHPFFVILVVIAGSMIWGVIGMILAIPVLGIINVVFQHIKVLHPYAFLLSKKDPFDN